MADAVHFDEPLSPTAETAVRKMKFDISSNCEYEGEVKDIPKVKYNQKELLDSLLKVLFKES